MMIEIASGHYVAADQVARIETAANADVVRVILKDGSSWTSHPDHGKSKYAHADKLVAAINGAVSEGVK